MIDEIDENVKTPEVVRVFDDRYEAMPLFCDEVITPPKMKSILVKDGIMMNVDLPESSNLKVTPAVLSLPGPRPVLISDLPKVFSFIPKSPIISIFSNLNHLDINPNCNIPVYFDDFLTLAWLAFLIPDQTKEPAPSCKEIEDLEEDEIMEIAPAQFTPRKRRPVKVKEELDEEFLRCSKRNTKPEGFKTPQKKEKAQEKRTPRRRGRMPKRRCLSQCPWP